MKLQEDEEILLQFFPEKSVLGIWFFSKCVVYVFVGTFFSVWSVGFVGGIFSVVSETQELQLFSNVFVALPIVSTIILIMSLWYISVLRKTFKYVVTNQRCIFIGGILRRTERSIPLHKVTDVEWSQNFVERYLGIAKVKIFTPGTASMAFSPFGRQSSEIIYEGLSDSERVSETLNNQIRLFMQNSSR